MTTTINNKTVLILNKSELEKISYHTFLSMTRDVDVIAIHHETDNNAVIKSLQERFTEVSDKEPEIKLNFLKR